MQEQIYASSNAYLERFDQILSTMSNKMLSSQVTNNITRDFIRNMIPHHEGAILMCENLLRYTNNLALQNLAQTIIATQIREIENMRTIYRASSNYINPQNATLIYNQMYLMIVRQMITRMENSARTPSVDLDFIDEMIPHHEGAILMCENVLHFTIDPRLQTLAQTIIRNQTKGVEQLYAIRNQLLYRSSN